MRPLRLSYNIKPDRQDLLCPYNAQAILAPFYLYHPTFPFFCKRSPSYSHFLFLLLHPESCLQPLPSDHKFRFIPNALLLPHIGYVTAENYSIFYNQMIDNLEACVSGKPIREIK